MPPLILARLAAPLALVACTGVITPPEPLPPRPDPVLMGVVDVDPPFAPAPQALRKLLANEYIASVRELLGDAAAAEVIPPLDTALNGFEAIGAAQLSLSTVAVARYEEDALRAAQKALEDPARAAQIIGCDPSGRGCLNFFVTNFGRRAFRRALDDDERQRWIAIGQEAISAYESFEKGVAFVISGMLQSPNFLYRDESGTADETKPGWALIKGTQMATRLSYFVAGAPPSPALLDAAERGELDTAEGVRAYAQTLLSHPSAETAMVGFFEDLMQLRGLELLGKDASMFPDFWLVAESMKEETRRLVADVVWTRDVDFQEMFDANYTFLDRTLAEHYGMRAYGIGMGGAFRRVEFPSTVPRGGLLAHGSFLARNAHAQASSPTYRGKFIRERLMCQSIPAPPANVNTTLPMDPPGTGATSAREKLIRHRTDPQCAGCHRLMDDIGLGLEKYDAGGRYRTEDLGAVIDSRSHIEGLGTFDGPRELGALLRREPAIARCMVRNLFRYATAHVELPTEIVALKALDERFNTENHRMKALVVELAASDAFRWAQAPALETP